MIITVTFNPAIDKYSEIEKLQYDEPMRAVQSEYDAGGKGINVSRVIKRFGIDAPALYFGGGGFSSFFESMLDKEKVESERVPITENMRINHTVYDKSAGRILKFNSAGPSVEPDETEKMVSLIKNYARKDNIIVLSGNLPPNVDINIYSRIINEIRGKVKLACLDTESHILAETLAVSSPDIIKPNLPEAQRLTGMELKTDKDFKAALDKLREKVKNPIISAGEKGVYYYDTADNRYYQVEPPKIKALSTAGAGDSFMAGFIMSVSEGKPMMTAAKTGVACGTATAMAAGHSLCYPKDVLDLLGRIKIKIID